MFLLFHLSFFFFNDTATTEIYTLSLHDALPICLDESIESYQNAADAIELGACRIINIKPGRVRSEEHTSELQSRENLVCRLLLEKKNPWRLLTPPLLSLSSLVCLRRWRLCCFRR